MKQVRLIIGVAVLIISSPGYGQTISSALPAIVNPNGNFLFYLHGGVVTDEGNNGMTKAMPQWGRYEYLNILDSLRNRGFTVVSERRRPGVDDSLYVNKIVRQVDSLLQNGVPINHVMIVGASSGAAITLNVASALKTKRMKYIIMGACWPDTYKSYLGLTLEGRFLSIIEKSDPHGTCSAIFNSRPKVSRFQEIVLNTGLSHGFLFKGYKDWLDPVTKWYWETE
ncbi:MAG: hypothetical protein JWR38_4201 [Mucilaginibacter sp.]|nr:hypothetical protein [Mucilaginibacter sp.]